MRKTVCLIGRPNTGKSTLFNRLINEKKSIIDDTPGVTRDRIYGICNFEDKSFHLIDTGGIQWGDGDWRFRTVYYIVTLAYPSITDPDWQVTAI